MGRRLVEAVDGDADDPSSDGAVQDSRLPVAALSAGEGLDHEL
jgi:hypothetical protein